MPLTGGEIPVPRQGDVALQALPLKHGFLIIWTGFEQTTALAITPSLSGVGAPRQIEPAGGGFDAGQNCSEQIRRGWQRFHIHWFQPDNTLAHEIDASADGLIVRKGLAHSHRRFFH